MERSHWWIFFSSKSILLLTRKGIKKFRVAIATWKVNSTILLNHSILLYKSFCLRHKLSFSKNLSSLYKELLRSTILDTYTIRFFSYLVNLVFRTPWGNFPTYFFVLRLKEYKNKCTSDAWKGLANFKKKRKEITKTDSLTTFLKNLQGWVWPWCKSSQLPL